MKRRQAYRFELDPNNAQRTALAKHAGAARFAYNWGLQEIKGILEARARGSDQKVPTAFDLGKQWNEWKREHVAWWVEVSKCAPQEAFKDLQRGLRNFLDSRTGKRKGKRVGFPRYRKRGVRDRFRYSTGTFLPVDRRHVRLPRLGRIRSKEPTTKLLTSLGKGSARMTSATVSREADRWFVSFAVEVESPDPMSVKGEVVGVDRGLKTFAMLSDGTRFDHPRALGRDLRKLRRLSRAHSRKQKGSENRKKSALRLARLHRRIRNRRRDFLHKTTTELTRTKRVIVVEDLDVHNLSRNRRLARHIADAAWGEFARMLTYKTNWYGSVLIVADREFPSSKTCSSCGSVRAKLSLAERVFSCTGCGIVLDRDLNAAVNLARLAEPVAVSSTETQNACGGGRFMATGQVPRSEAGTEPRVQ